MTCLTDPPGAGVLDRPLGEAPRDHEVFLQQRRELVARDLRQAPPSSPTRPDGPTSVTDDGRLEASLWLGDGS